MPALVAAIIGVIALALVVAPLVRRGGRSARAGAPAADPAGLQELLDQRETLLRAMADIAYDRRLGNLSEEEHGRLRADYELQAIAVLRALDQRAVGIEEEIEREVQEHLAARARGEAPAHGGAIARENGAPTVPEPVEAPTGQAAGLGRG